LNYKSNYDAEKESRPLTNEIALNISNINTYCNKSNTKY